MPGDGPILQPVPASGVRRGRVRTAGMGAGDFLDLAGGLFTFAEF